MWLKRKLKFYSPSSLRADPDGRLDRAHLHRLVTGQVEADVRVVCVARLLFNRKLVARNRTTRDSVQLHCVWYLLCKVALLHILEVTLSNRDLFYEVSNRVLEAGDSRRAVMFPWHTPQSQCSPAASHRCLRQC